MAEDILVGGVGEIVNKLISLGFDEIGLFLGVEKEVEKLRTTLVNIQDDIESAERIPVGNKSAMLWLKQLREAALDAEDILDEYGYPDLRSEVIPERKVRKLLSCFCTLAPRFKTAHSIQNITERLQDIEKRKPSEVRTDDVGVNSNPNLINNDRDTMSLVDASVVIGRDEERSKLVKLLIGDQGSSSVTSFSVIPIVGLGGLGKTTLAQLVFNDPGVKRHFGSMMMWVCVLEDFEVTSVWDKILKGMNSSGNDGSSPSNCKEELQKKLQKQLDGKKFFLVLDDFWKKDLSKWDDLILPLKLYGGSGSRILVTTRDEAIALKVGAENIHKLLMLSDEQSVSLFESRAFRPGGPERTPSLVEIGREIVKKCGGVPLAIKALGGLMFNKTTEREWVAVRENDDAWKISNDLQDNVMGVLKLSYNNLPPQVRQCFSYCSIFPKDYEMKKHELIQLWMAQGFLGEFENDGLVMEDKGDEYFKTLCMISFFQNVKMSSHEDEISCMMHDLVHDLAQDICGSESKVAMTDVRINKDLIRCRHLSWFSSNIPNDINEVKKLRTFSSLRSTRFIGSNIPKLFELRLLRVLNLSYLFLDELPHSIGGLKLLKYLNLSKSSIKRLPPSIIDLCNLQTLNLQDCRNLEELPKNVRALTKLRYFYTFNKFQKFETPMGLKELPFLQRLDRLKLCGEHASAHIAELEHLHYLGGTLRIMNLECVEHTKDAKKANLSGKKNIHTLHLEWKATTLDHSWSDVTHDGKLLEALQPHPNLKELTVKNFQGVELPSWMSNGSALSHLVKLELQNCRKCTQILSLGGLPSLKELQIHSMDSLSHFGEDHQVAELATTSIGEIVFEAVAAPPWYPCLEKLSLSNLKNLEEWFENNSNAFPNLRELMLRKCPELRKAPHLFSPLKKLSLNDVGSLVVASLITSNLTSLTSLFIDKISDGPTFLSSPSSSEEVLRIVGENKLLEMLRLDCWPVIKSMLDLRGLHFLRKVQLSDCQELETLVGLPCTLEVLEISACPKLTIEAAQLPCLKEMSICNINAFVVVDGSWSNQLVILKIEHVPEFRHLPVDFLQSHEHLLEAHITSCPKFEGFLSSNQGQVGLCNESSSSTSSSSLLELHLKDLPSMSSSGLQLQGLTQLGRLTCCGCTRFESLEGLQFLPKIWKLSIGPFSEELDYFPFLDATQMGHLISSLCMLDVYGWSGLRSLPEQLQHLQQLRRLKISFFDGVVDLPDWLGKLTSLQQLVIENCKNLMRLPSANEIRKLKSLRELWIENCPLLKERCEDKNRGNSDSEWHKISHIPHIWLYDPPSESESEQGEAMDGGEVLVGGEKEGEGVEQGVGEEEDGIGEEGVRGEGDMVSDCAGQRSSLRRHD